VKLSIIQSIFRWRCLLLLLSLVLLVLLYPTAGAGFRTGFLVLFLNSLTLVTASFTLTQHVDSMKLSLGLGALQLTLALSAYLFQLKPLEVGAWVLFIIFYVVAIVHVLGYVARGQKVTADKIFGGMSAYIMLAVAWAGIYRLMYEWNEEAFFVDPARNIQGLFGSPDLLYFSFITLTTLGYGDITPVAGYARASAALESMTGLFFMAILVARLVSLYKPAGMKEDQ